MREIKTQSGYIQAGQETLAYRIVSKQDHTPLNLLSLHGGGPTGKERIYYVAKHLARQDFSSVSFDFSGHGESSGHIKESSLQKRVSEAIHMAEHIRMDFPITLIGTSMGGHIALALLPHLHVKNLILFCPALYSKEAFTVPFGSGFTEIIRRKNSYEQADVLEHLKTFTGNLLLITAEKDEIIPEQVIDLYINNAVNVSNFKHLQLEGTPHVIHGWAEKHSDIKYQILKHLSDFLSEE